MLSSIRPWVRHAGQMPLTCWAVKPPQYTRLSSNVACMLAGAPCTGTGQADVRVLMQAAGLAEYADAWALHAAPSQPHSHCSASHASAAVDVGCSTCAAFCSSCTSTLHAGSAVACCGMLTHRDDEWQSSRLPAHDHARGPVEYQAN